MAKSRSGSQTQTITTPQEHQTLGKPSLPATDPIAHFTASVTTMPKAAAVDVDASGFTIPVFKQKTAPLTEAKAIALLEKIKNVLALYSKFSEGKISYEFYEKMRDQCILQNIGLDAYISRHSIWALLVQLDRAKVLDPKTLTLLVGEMVFDASDKPSGNLNLALVSVFYKNPEIVNTVIDTYRASMRSNANNRVALFNDIALIVSQLTSAKLAINDELVQALMKQCETHAHPKEFAYQLQKTLEYCNKGNILNENNYQDIVNKVEAIMKSHPGCNIGHELNILFFDNNLNEYSLNKLLARFLSGDTTMTRISFPKGLIAPPPTAAPVSSPSPVVGQSQSTTPSPPEGASSPPPLTLKVSSVSLFSTSISTTPEPGSSPEPSSDQDETLKPPTPD